MADPPILRTFERAPVIETVLSVQFAPLAGFSVAHFGLYWNRIREQFPHTEIKPPIMHIVEDFERKEPKQTLPQVVGWPAEQLIRCWFLDEKRNFFVQLQHDRLLLNWQKMDPGDIYPRYSIVRAKFLEEWNRFCSFLQDEHFGTPRVDQCEVTYVNHIEYGVDLTSYGDLPRVVAPWSGKSSGNFLPDAEKISINVQYPISQSRGRLYISLQPVIRRKDGKEVLQLNLTARGAPESSSAEHIFSWLDLGRKWIVEGFTDFTTREMHKQWGLEQ